MSQLSLFSSSDLAESALWCVPRGADRFVLALPSPVPHTLGHWLLGSGCLPLKSALVPDGVAFLLQVPAILVPVFLALPTHACGSRHPANYLPF
ncbi:MAG TPA: hypothetical protein V6D29_05645 [Leptolyngbyaceae cyanobacterium]